MRSRINDIDRLADIAEFALKIKQQVALLNEAMFLKTELEKWGLVKWLENIGEAAYQISDETKAEYNELEWKMMAGARHVYVHDYFKIDWNKVWLLLQSIYFEDVAAKANNIKTTLTIRYSFL